MTTCRQPPFSKTPAGRESHLRPSQGSRKGTATRPYFPARTATEPPSPILAALGGKALPSSRRRSGRRSRRCAEATCGSAGSAAFKGPAALARPAARAPPAFQRSRRRRPRPPRRQSSFCLFVIRDPPPYFYFCISVRCLCDFICRRFCDARTFLRSCLE